MNTSRYLDSHTYIDDSALERLVEPENREAFIGFPYIIQNAYRISYRSGKSSIFESHENIAPRYWGINMSVELKDIIHHKASQLLESGILPRLIKNADKDPIIGPEELGPQVLTLQHLSAGFVVIFGLLGLSFVAFLAEFVPTMLRNMKEWLEKFCVCIVVVKFVKMNKML
jgi:hypothetical protein